MAYIHCGNRSCHWSSDDFWSLRFKPQLKFWRWRSVFGFNPITCFLEQIGRLIKPRWIGFDKWAIDEIYAHHGYKIRSRIVYEMVDCGGPFHNCDIQRISKHQVHSWSLLGWEWTRMLIKFRNQKWWTYKAYKNDPEKLCPKCGQCIPSSCID